MPRSRRGLSRTESLLRDRRKALTIVGLLAVAIIAVGVLVHFITPTPPDPLTGCPVGQGAPPAHTVVLIDETDRLSTAELTYTRDLIYTEYAWLPQGGRLTVRNIMADPAQAHDVTICRMRDASSALGFVVNPEALQRTFERLAGAQLDELMQALAVAEPQEASPIMEAASEAMDRSDFGRGIPVRRLVIQSDFAQHSELFSQYGRVSRDLPDEALDLVWRDMDGVAVRLHYIPRRDLRDIQGRRHQSFWQDHFESMNADVAVGHDLLIGEDPAERTVVTGPQSRRTRDAQ